MVVMPLMSCVSLRESGTGIGLLYETVVTTVHHGK